MRQNRLANPFVKDGTEAKMCVTYAILVAMSGQFQKLFWHSIQYYTLNYKIYKNYFSIIFKVNRNVEICRRNSLNFY